MTRHFFTIDIPLHGLCNLINSKDRGRALELLDQEFTRKYVERHIAAGTPEMSYVSPEGFPVQRAASPHDLALPIYRMTEGMRYRYRDMKRRSHPAEELAPPFKKQAKGPASISPNVEAREGLVKIMPILSSIGESVLTESSGTSSWEGKSSPKCSISQFLEITSFPGRFVQGDVVHQTEMLETVSAIIQEIANDIIETIEKKGIQAPRVSRAAFARAREWKTSHMVIRRSLELTRAVRRYSTCQSEVKTKFHRFEFGELRASFHDRDGDGLHPGDRVCLVPDILVLEVKVLGVTAYRIEFAIMNKRLCKKPEDLIIRAKDRRRPQVSTGSQTKNVVAGNSTSGELLQKKCDRLKVNLQQWEENIAEMKANNEEILFYDAPVPLEEIPEKFLERLVKNPAFLCNDGNYCDRKPGIYAWKKIREECRGSCVSTKKRVRDFGKFHELWLELDVSELERQIGVDPGWRAELEVAMYVDRRATSSHPNYMLGMTSTAEKLINQIKWGDQGLPRDLTNRAKDWEKEREDDWDVKKGFITCALAKGELEPKRDVCLDLVDKGNCSGLAWELHKFEDGSLVDVPLLTQLMLLKEHKGQGWEEINKEYEKRGWTLSPVEDMSENPSIKRFKLTAGSSKYAIKLSLSEKHLEWQVEGNRQSDGNVANDDWRNGCLRAISSSITPDTALETGDEQFGPISPLNLPINRLEGKE